MILPVFFLTSVLYCCPSEAALLHSPPPPACSGRSRVKTLGICFFPFGYRWLKGHQICCFLNCYRLESCVVFFVLCVGFVVCGRMWIVIEISHFCPLPAKVLVVNFYELNYGLCVTTFWIPWACPGIFCIFTLLFFTLVGW